MLKTYPRRKLFLGWTDLFQALWHCLFSIPLNKLHAEICSLWTGQKTPLAALSVRSLLDATFKALAFEPGGEVLLSAVTIPDIPEIIKAHQLVPLPFRFDPQMLAPANLAELERLISPRCKAILIAPLFGSLVNLDGISQLAQRHNLFLIEDLAQAYRGPSFHGDARSDLVLFSFGPIKHSTSLGGAVGLFKNNKIAEDVARHLQQLPAYSNLWFFKRILKFVVLKCFSNPWVFGTVSRALIRIGFDWEPLLSAALRSFPKGEALQSIRHQPPSALLALLLRRLRNFNAPELAAQRELALHFASCLSDPKQLLGSHALAHNYWVFPFLADTPQLLTEELRQYGFDASAHSSLVELKAPQDQEQASHWLARVVFLPVYLEMPRNELDRLAELCVKLQKQRFN